MLVDLDESRTWSAPVRRDGVDLRVAQGTVWITQEADPDDHVLSAPATFESRRGGKIVVYALTPARVEVVRPWPLVRPPTSPGLSRPGRSTREEPLHRRVVLLVDRADPDATEPAGSVHQRMDRDHRTPIDSE